MPADPVAALLDRLDDSGLVPPDHLRSLREWVAAGGAGVGQVVQEVVGRGLLTRFQLREVAAGRAAGLTLGPYQLLDLLGEGGMGRVYRGRHTRLGREVAVKLVRPERLSRPTVIDRFRHEIRAAARLHHPNVVMAIDADEADGRHYYVMEYVPGSDLAKMVADRGPLPVAEACGYARQAADGLQHAADLGMVHRDVKPANLLVTPDGRVKVLDLGLAQLTADPDAASLGWEGKIVGSPDFMAPEQARDPLAVDTRADVYGLGGTLFFLLTGRPPFGGDSPTDKVMRHLNTPPPSLLADRTDVSPALDAIVRWMLNKSPDDRPPSPAAVAAALAPFASAGPAPVHQPPVPHPEPAFPRFDDLPVIRRATRPARRRVGLPWVVAGVVAATLVVGIAATGFRGGTSGGGPTEPPAGITNSVGMRLVWLPGRSFTMGSPTGEPGREADEPVAAETVVGPFCVAATEVSQGQYLAVVGKSPARWPARLRESKSAPVDSVTWAEAVEFCRRLTAADAGRWPGWGYRLPTGAEWEYAARAGTATPFWSGDRLRVADGVYNPDARDDAGLGDPSAWPRTVEKGLPHPVGGTRGNPFGIHDPCGNVWEWTADDVTAGGAKVARGGSWREPPGRCRSAARRGLDPSRREDDVGFRVVYAPQPGT